MQTGLYYATSEDDYVKVITEGLEGRISKTKLKNFAKNPTLNLELNSLASAGKVPKQTF